MYQTLVRRIWASNHIQGNRDKVKVKVAQSCPTLCDPIFYTVHGILQARILEWVAFPFSRGSSQPRDQTQVSHIAARFFTSWAAWERSRLPCGIERIVKVKTGVDNKTGKLLKHKNIQAHVSLAIGAITSSHITSGTLYCIPVRKKWKRQITS